jgi:hypothetical protein
MLFRLKPILKPNRVEFTKNNSFYFMAGFISKKKKESNFTKEVFVEEKKQS